MLVTWNIAVEGCLLGSYTDKAVLMLGWIADLRLQTPRIRETAGIARWPSRLPAELSGVAKCGRIRGTAVCALSVETPRPIDPSGKLMVTRSL